MNKKLRVLYTLVFLALALVNCQAPPHHAAPTATATLPITVTLEKEGKGCTALIAGEQISLQPIRNGWTGLDKIGRFDVTVTERVSVFDYERMADDPVKVQGSCS